MRLGGWARIGVLISVVLGALVGLVAYQGQPTSQTIYNRWFLDASAIISNSVTDAEGQYVSITRVQEAYFSKSVAENVAWLTQIERSPTSVQKVFSAKIAALNIGYRKEISELPQQRVNYWSEAFGWWLGGTLLVFSIGWSIGWVARGFRKSAA